METATFTHFISRRLTESADADTTTGYAAHCGVEVNLSDVAPVDVRAVMTWNHDEVTCEECVTKGFDRGQKQARTMRLNKAKKQADAEAAQAARARNEAVTRAQRRYMHLQRVVLMPFDFKARSAFAETLQPMQQDIFETVQNAVNEIRREVADVARSLQGIKQSVDKAVAATPSTEDTFFSGMAVNPAMGMLHETTWIGDTAKLHQQAEELQKKARTVFSLAWAAGYIVPDMASKRQLAEHELVRQLRVDLEANTVTDLRGGQPTITAFPDSNELWIRVGQIIEDVQVEA